MKKILLAFTLVLFVAAGQNITNTIENLKTNLPEMLETSFGKKLPSVDEGMEMLKEKCLKQGKNETFDKANEVHQNFLVFLRENVDLEQMEDEIKEAKPKGDLDTVFRKYCGKSSHVKDYVKNMTDILEECLDESDKPYKSVASDIVSSLLNFVCYKEGDRIALFIAEGGPECLGSKSDKIAECANTTFGKYSNIYDSDSSWSFNETDCVEMSEVQKCVVNHLEECHEPTPANIVNSLFEFVTKKTPCKDYLKTKDDSSPNLQHTLLSFLLPILAIIISKL